MPIWSVLETSATLYKKNPEQFHVLLTEPAIHGFSIEAPTPTPSTPSTTASTTLFPATNDSSNRSRLLWLEISPRRVTMTMQGNGHFSYRHFWEQGIYGLNRYWLQGDRMDQTSQIRLRNFTRNFTLTGGDIPEHLRLEYELWSHHVCLGHYVMNLEIH